MSDIPRVIRGTTNREPDFVIKDSKADFIKFWFWGSLDLMLYEPTLLKFEKLSVAKFIDGKLHYCHPNSDIWREWEEDRAGAVINARNEAIEKIEKVILGETDE